MAMQIQWKLSNPDTLVLACLAKSSDFRGPDKRVTLKFAVNAYDSCVYPVSLRLVATIEQQIVRELSEKRIGQLGDTLSGMREEYL